MTTHATSFVFHHAALLLGTLFFCTSFALAAHTYYVDHGAVPVRSVDWFTNGKVRWHAFNVVVVPTIIAAMFYAVQFGFWFRSKRHQNDPKRKAHTILYGLSSVVCVLFVRSCAETIIYID